MPLATTSVRTIHPAANEPQNKESRDANLQDTAALLRRFSNGCVNELSERVTVSILTVSMDSVATSPKRQCAQRIIPQSRSHSSI